MTTIRIGTRRSQLAAGLAKLVGRDEVLITENVDPEIIGGVVAKVGEDRKSNVGTPVTSLTRMPSAA